MTPARLAPSGRTAWSPETQGTRATAQHDAPPMNSLHDGLGLDCKPYNSADATHFQPYIYPLYK